MLWNRLNCHSPANRALSGKALAGVVGSGDMEVLYTAGQSNTLNVEITTSVDNSLARWNALFERLSRINGLPVESWSSTTLAPPRRRADPH